MILRHMQILRAVARTGSFTKAAEHLYLTQSAVSHAVRDMENRAGTALFDRLPKGVRLTPCGRRLLEEAAPILAAWERLEARMDTMQADTPCISSPASPSPPFGCPASCGAFPRHARKPPWK